MSYLKFKRVLHITPPVSVCPPSGVLGPESPPSSSVYIQQQTVHVVARGKSVCRGAGRRSVTRHLSNSQSIQLTLL